MSNTKQILAMLRSRAEGDEEQFYSIALQVAASEARQGHRSIADALRRAVEQARAKSTKNEVTIEFSRPRGKLDGLLELKEPRFLLDEVVLSAALHRRLGDLVRQQEKRTWLREHGKTPNRRVLFLGPPGSGKTMTAEALAGQLHLPLFVIRLEGLITRFMGETATKLRLVFEELATRRGVYLFDEFDAIGGTRSAANDVAEMRRVLNSFLQYMEEESSTDSLIIGATNHPELLDKALLRRFDTVLTFAMPTAEDVKRIVLSNVRPFKTYRMVWDEVVEACEGLSQAEIAKASEEAVKSAILNEKKSISTNDLLGQVQDRAEMRSAFLVKPAE